MKKFRAAGKRSFGIAVKRDVGGVMTFGQAGEGSLGDMGEGMRDSGEAWGEVFDFGEARTSGFPWISAYKSRVTVPVVGAGMALRTALFRTNIVDDTVIWLIYFVT
jgi:hypothetical protein